jgi:hypothetical protein
LDEERRRIGLAEFKQKPTFEQVPRPVEPDGKISGQKMVGERFREKSNSSKEISNDVAEKRTLSR